MENIKDKLLKNLVEMLSISEEKAEEVIIFLTETHGVESIENVRLLKEEDLAPVLKTIQRRKFLLSWAPQSKKYLTI